MAASTRQRFTFTRASKDQAKARIALVGPPGSGKTFTSLTLASTLGQRIAVIDTERGRSAKYANEFVFDVAVLDYFSPQNLVEALGAAASAGYDVVVVDSLTHFWSGTGGMLEQVDNASGDFGGNAFSGWRNARPLERRMVEALTSYPGHVVATMRAKAEYAMETNDRGKKEPTKVGMKADQRDGLEYEFDIVAWMDLQNTLSVTKSCARHLNGAIVPKPDAQFGQAVRDWLEDGVAVEPVENLIAEALREDATFDELRDLMGRVRDRRLESVPIVANGMATTLGAHITDRGRALRQAADRDQEA